MISGQILDGKNIIEAKNLLQSGDTQSGGSLWSTDRTSFTINGEDQLPIILFTSIASSAGSSAPIYEVTNYSGYPLIAIMIGFNANVYISGSQDLPVDRTTSINTRSIGQSEGIAIVMIVRELM